MSMEPVDRDWQQERMDRRRWEVAKSLFVKFMLDDSAGDVDVAEVAALAVESANELVRQFEGKRPHCTILGGDVNIDADSAQEVLRKMYEGNQPNMVGPKVVEINSDKPFVHGES